MASGVAGGVEGDLLGGAGGDEAAAGGAAFGAEVEDPVGAEHDVEVVFDDDDGVAVVDEVVEDAHEDVDVGGVEAGGGFVEDEKAALAGEFEGKLEALAFAAGEGGEGLAEVEVAEADAFEEGELAADVAVGEEVGGFAGGHVEDVGDVLASVAGGEGFGGVAEALAGGAFEADVVHEVHVDAEEALALAFGAGAFGVEAEEGGWLADGGGVLLADGVEDAEPGGRIGAAGAADGLLIDEDAVGVLLGEDVVDEGAFAGAGDAGDADEDALGDGGVEVGEVVDGGVADFKGGGPGAAGTGEGGGGGAEGAAGRGVGAGEVGDGAGEAEVASGAAGGGADFDDVVGGADDVEVVFDDEDGVALVAQLAEDADEVGGVAGVEADGGFVEDVEEAGEVAVELAGELDALAFAAGEGGDGAGEGEVADADVDEVAEEALDLAEEGGGEGGVEFGEGVAEGVEFHVGIFGKGAAEEADGAGAGVEAGAGAFGAVAVDEVGVVDGAFVLGGFVVGLVLGVAVEAGGDAFEGFAVGDAGGGVFEDAFFGVEEEVEEVGRVVGELLVDVEEAGVDDFEPEVTADLAVGVGDGAFAEGEGGVDELGGVDGDLAAEALAGGAGAGGDVEGEEVGGADGGFAEAGEEHAQVGGDFGGGADGGAEGAAHGGLVDDDGGGEVEDVVDVGAGELGEEAAGEGAEGFDPLALGFGVKGVEDEGGFAGAGDAGDGDELVLGDVEVEALEVVGAGAADLDEVGMDVHGGGLWGTR